MEQEEWKKPAKALQVLLAITLAQAVRQACWPIFMNLTYEHPDRAWWDTAWSIVGYALMALACWANWQAASSPAISAPTQRIIRGIALFTLAGLLAHLAMWLAYSDHKAPPMISTAYSVLVLLVALAEVQIPWLVARARGLAGVRWVAAIVGLYAITGPCWHFLWRQFFTSLRHQGPLIEGGLWLFEVAPVAEILSFGLPVILWGSTNWSADQSGWRFAGAGLNVLRWAMVWRFVGIPCGLFLLYLAQTDPKFPSYSLEYDVQSLRNAVVRADLLTIGGYWLFRRLRTPFTAVDHARASFVWTVAAALLGLLGLWSVGKSDPYDRSVLAQFSWLWAALSMVGSLLATRSLLHAFAPIAFAADDNARGLQVQRLQSILPAIIWTAALALLLAELGLTSLALATVAATLLLQLYFLPSWVASLWSVQRFLTQAPRDPPSEPSETEAVAEPA